MMRVVFMFSGQGSQYYHMGRQLYSEHPIFRKWMHNLDDVVCGIIGESIVDQIYSESGRQRDQPFERLLYTHPAIFMVEYSLAHVLIESGVRPDYVLGTSMGEFASAAFAGTGKVEELLQALIKQVECFETYCEKGGMLAIIHDPDLYSTTPLIYENSELVSINFSSHFVISGKVKQIGEIERYLKRANILYQSLPVSYGFHSSCIDPAAPVYKKFLSTKTYQASTTPIISCVYGSLITDIPNDYFWNVVRKPIQFAKAVHAIENVGQEHIYLDLGPGGTLSNFVKHNLAQHSRSQTHAIMTPFHHDLRSLENVKKLFC